jgi:glycogen debranching enzyme
MDLRRLPELFCGFRRLPATGPTLYPVACAPQAWAAAAPFALLQSVLGLGFDAPRRAVRFDRPRLPVSLDELTIRQLGFDDARCDVHLRRLGDEVAVDVADRRGDVEVVVRL